MLETSQCLRTRSKIITLTKLENNIIAFSTNLHGAKLLNAKNYDTLTTISHEKLNGGESLSVSFSPNAEFMAFGINSYIYILHVTSNILLKTIKTDNEIIESLEFDAQSKYIIVATQSGRVLQYRYDGSSLLARLYSFNIPNNKKKNNSVVSAFAFKNNLMACAGDNGTLFSINLHSRANKVVINNSTSRVNSIAFIDENKLLSGDNKGNLYINSIKDGSLIKKIETPFTKVKQVLLMPDTQHLLVSSDENYAAVYDIYSYKLIHSKYVEFDAEVSKIIVSDNHTLIASLVDNTLIKIDLPDKEKLKAFIRSKELNKAYAFVKQHQILKATKEYELLEDAYSNISKQALEALINQNTEKAKELTKIFKYTDEKTEDIQLLFKAFENYSRFKNLYIEKKLPLAYTMSEKFPALKKTFQYAKMEEQWEKSFSNAQRQIAFGQLDNAKTLLHDYATVLAKRPIVKLIINHNNEFLAFLKAIEEKNFKKIESIAKTNELFKHVPTFKTIEQEMQSSLVLVQKDIAKCDLDAAIKKLTHLQNIESISSIVNDLKNECKALKKLQDAYAVNNFVKCYETVDTYNALNSTELGTLLQKHWFEIISKCESFALKGNIKDIKITLGELIHLSTRRDKIGDLFRVSFHSKIKALLATKSYKKAEAIIYSYIDIFGIDNELLSIMRIYESMSKKPLAITQNSRQPRDSWINSSTIMDS